jgi:prepilin-type N-terminal cleavage/methylation domain-containing protein
MVASPARGFTLIELVFVIVILAIIAGVSSNLIGAQFNAHFTSQNINNADGQVRLALARVTRDIQAIPHPTNITTASASQLVFTDQNAVVDTYTVTGGNLTRNGQILATGVNNMTFVYRDLTGAVTAVIANIRYITITLAVTQGNVNYNIRTTVTSKNFV